MAEKKPTSAEEIGVVDHEYTGIAVQIWPRSALGDGAMVVQIDTSAAASGRLRVNLNDAPIWDGDAEREDWPGGDFAIDWPGVHVSEEVARTVLDFFDGRGAGRFASLLIQTILAADDEHTEALGLGLREWVRAVHLWKSDKSVLLELAGRS